MNVYLIQDGADPKCWAAETMAEAIDAAYSAYLAENELTESEENEREYYERSLLESCVLVGELGNGGAGE